MEIRTDIFLLSGAISFFIISVCNVAILMNTFDNIGIFSKIQSLTFTLFYLATCGYFVYMYKQQMPEARPKEEQELIDKAFKQLETQKNERKNKL